MAECGIPDLYHFVYVNKNQQQFVMPAFESPYITTRSRKRFVLVILMRPSPAALSLGVRRLFRLYQNIHVQMHRPENPLKNYFYAGHSEVATLQPCHTPTTRNIDHTRVHTVGRHVGARPSDSPCAWQVICAATSKDYELHAAFSPLITKNLAFTAFNRCMPSPRVAGTSLPLFAYMTS